MFVSWKKNFDELIILDKYFSNKEGEKKDDEKKEESVKKENKTKKLKCD